MLKSAFPTKARPGASEEQVDKPLDPHFQDQLREILNIGRELGRNEFRIASMRMFEDLEYYEAARRVGRMNVDAHLTPEEIANRGRMP